MLIKTSLKRRPKLLYLHFLTLVDNFLHDLWTMQPNILNDEDEIEVEKGRK